MTTLKADLKAAKEAEKKAENDLKSTQAAHTLALANKDKEVQILLDELRDAKTRRVDVEAEYSRSMDFVHRLANRYNEGWSAAMRCTQHALPGIE